MKHPASSQLTPYVVVVRVNGSHLIKNYLITFLALISGAWLSLARAPRLPRHRCHLLFLSCEQSAHTTTSFNPLSPSTSVSCLLHLLLHPPSLLHSVHNQPAAKSLSWFAFFFSLPPCHCRQPPLAHRATLQQSAALPSLSLFPFFFPCSPEVRLATSYPKRRKLPVNVISLLIRFSSRFSRTANPPAPHRAPRDPASAGITPLLPGTRLWSYL